MKEAALYRFGNRMPRFMELARTSYVGPRIYPLAAFLYAAMNAELDGRSVHMPTFLRVTDMIRQFVTDGYYKKMIDNSDWESDIEVPQDIVRTAFNEIIEGAQLLDDVTDKWLNELSSSAHRFRVVPDVRRNALLVIRR